MLRSLALHVLVLCMLAGSGWSQPPGQPAFREDRILIRPKPGIAPEAFAASPILRMSKVLATFPAINNLQVVSVPAGATVHEVLLAYRQSGLVIYAEPDYARDLALVPNDPRFLDGTLWALHNVGQGGGTPDADIDAPEAWDILNSASNIVVAVLDTGIRRTHEDLAINVWTNTALGGFGWNALAGTTSPNDDEGHGSMMAGVIGAAGNNGKGVAGVAWRVQVMACKCFNSMKTGYDSDIIACLEFARTNGARIVNASLGSYGFSQALYDAIDTARQDGIIVVAAAGNDGKDVDASPYYPACFDLDNVVSVGFTTRKDLLDSRSNFGATNVDLVAPGAAMYSTFFPSDTMYLGGEFLYGSSMAAPYVTGTLALMLAKYPGETAPQIINRLLLGTDRLPGLAGKCLTGGRLNLRNALSPPIVLAAAPAAAGEPFHLHVSAGPGRTCFVERTDDLSTWTRVSTNSTSPAGTFVFTDADWQTTAARFYRVVSAPQGP